VGIGNLFDTETIQCFQIHLLLCLFEFRDGYFSMINCQEVNKFFEVNNFLVTYLYGSLKGKNATLLLRFGFKEGFDSGFSYSKLV